MSSPAINTVIIKWQESLNKCQNKLIATDRLAKQQIAEGKAKPMDYDKL